MRSPRYAEHINPTKRFPHLKLLPPTNSHFICWIDDSSSDDKKRHEEEEAARAAIADKGEALKGRVKKWESSYGLIEISEQKEHRKVGGIFAHISDFENRGKKRIREGQKVEFKVVSQQYKYRGKYRVRQQVIH